MRKGDDMKSKGILWGMAFLIVILASNLILGQAHYDKVVRLADDTLQIINQQLVRITDGTEIATVNTDGRLDIVQHAHPDQSTVHMHKDGINSVQRFILIDKSDTTQFRHNASDYLHLEHLDLQIDASTTPSAKYKVSLYFINRIDSTDADLYTIWHLSGSRQTGLQTELYLPWMPNGIKCDSAFVTSGEVLEADTTYQLDVGLFSVLSKDSAIVYPGQGDLIVEFFITTGTIDQGMNVSYHGDIFK